MKDLGDHGEVPSAVRREAIGGSLQRDGCCVRKGLEEGKGQAERLPRKQRGDEGGLDQDGDRAEHKGAGS